MSPYFYVYLKLVLLAHVEAGDTISADLLAISLYTPRLAELSMPRRRVDVHGLVGEGERLYLQPLPCSWGALFAPRAWMVRSLPPRGRPHALPPRGRSSDVTCLSA